MPSTATTTPTGTARAAAVPHGDARRWEAASPQAVAANPATMSSAYINII